MNVDLSRLPPELRSFFEEARAGLLAPLPGEEPTFAKLGFASYDAYLKSSLWRRIRRRVLKRDESKCRRCKGTADLVHHLSYAIAALRGDADHLLVSLCDGCHNFIELDEHGGRRAPSERDKLLDVHDLDDLPEPVPVKISARKKCIPSPPQWGRMSAVQKSRWFAKAMTMSNRLTVVQIGPRYANSKGRREPRS